MKYPGLSGISFQQIEIFLTAARTENFSLTAQELFLTQATVSRNIQNMEHALGLVLFIRHKKRVVLTSAGKSLEKDLRQLLGKMDKALDYAFQQQQNQFNRLSIGDFNSTQMDSYLLPIAKAFEEDWPGIELAIQRSSLQNLIEGLRSGQYDAAFVISLSLDTLPIEHIAYEKIIDLTPCAVISQGHPLFYQDSISLDDLSQYTLISMRDGIYDEYSKFVQRVCSESGLQPEKVKFVANEFTMAMELKRGDRIAVMDQFYAPISPSELRYIPLPDCRTRSGIALVWSKECQNPFLSCFLETAKATAAALNTQRV